MVMVLPLDVANSREAAGLQMDVLWSILIICVAVMCFFVIPFAYFFYESDMDP